MLLLEFKKLVDESTSSLIFNDWEHACRELNIDTSAGYSRSMITDKLYEQIRNAFESNTTSNEKLSKINFIKLRKELVYRGVLYNEDPKVYLVVISTIQDATRQSNNNELPSFQNICCWKLAITAAKNYNTFSPDTFALYKGSLRETYSKDFDIATSVKWLIERGCIVDIVDSDISILAGIENVLTDLESKIAKIGGMVLANALFHHLNTCNHYSKRLERYYTTREVGFGSNTQSPQIPYGFLLNLAVKFPYENKIDKTTDKILKQIVDESKFIVNGLFGVQQYNIWDFHFQTGETIIEFCKEIALWDSMFAIPQNRFASAIKICKGLFLNYDNEFFNTHFGFSKEELFLIINTLNGLLKHIHNPAIIYHSKMCNLVKDVSSERILLILNFLSNKEKINKDYQLPSDYEKIDFWKTPLIKMGKTKFLLMNKTWSAPNYYEALALPIREVVKNIGRDFDEEMGIQLEVFLQDVLKHNNIKFYNGDYKVDRVQGECDLLIESEKAIVLVEFKKKPLTRKSKSGIDVELLLDLSDSLLSAQLQAGRTEIILREKGVINLLAKNGITSTIYLNSRHIERIALTHLEFGGFQDRNVCSTFLKSLVTHSFGTYRTEKKTIKKFKLLAEKQNDWTKQYTKLIELDKGFEHYPFFNCCFMSLPQLLEIINLSASNDEFYTYFAKTKYVTTHSLDWYREFEMATFALNDTD